MKVLKTKCFENILVGGKDNEIVFGSKIHLFVVFWLLINKTHGKTYH